MKKLLSSSLLLIFAVFYTNTSIFAADNNIKNKFYLSDIANKDIFQSTDDTDSNIIYGDADNNGTLTTSDAVMVLKKALNPEYKIPLEEITDDYIKYINVTVSGKLTSSDSAVILQKVLNNDYIMAIENKNKLLIEKTGWAYPNVLFWTLADYPENEPQNYLIEIYKNNNKIKDINFNLEAQNPYEEPVKIGAHIDLEDIMIQDEKGEYSFRVKALGNNINCWDSDFTQINNTYIYNQNSEERTFVSISNKNTIQVKTINSPNIYKWDYTISNDIIHIDSIETNPTYTYYYDYDAFMPGNSSCNITNFVPISPGNVDINFIYYNTSDENDILQTKTVKLNIDENLQVSIIS